MPTRLADVMATTCLGMLPLLLLLLHTKPTIAIPWQEAPFTVPAAANANQATAISSEIYPLPTPAPEIGIGNGTLESPSICGYVNHDFLNPYTCASALTCLWNSHLNIAACGSPSSITFHTSCIPYRYASSCTTNSTCMTDTSILHCPSDIPHCATARLGPAGNYSIRACQPNPVFGKLKVDLDYVGQSVLGHLPRWLGEGGVVRYGTVTPGMSGTSSKGPGGESGVGGGGLNPATVPGGVFTVVVSSYLPGFGGDKLCNATCRAVRYEAQVKKQVLAGGLVGGFMVLGLLAFGAW
ncbi:hypothetical protein IFR05_011494, partial [Cadophora sp. M221]